jgi:hypothetical protein
LRPWRNVNALGKVCIIFCVINMFLAIKLALIPSYLCLFQFFLAATCGLGTYSNKCQKE